MAGPAKQRAKKERDQKRQQQQQTDSSNDSSSASRDPTQRSINKFDGNKDPLGHGSCAVDHSRPNDMKNLSEFLGISGWYTARGVSANALLPVCVHMHADTRLICSHTMQTSRLIRILHSVVAELIKRSSSSFLVPSLHTHLFVYNSAALFQTSFPYLILSVDIYLYPHQFLSFIMSAKNVPMFQDVYSYRPRHANMDFNPYQLTAPTSLPQRPKIFNTYGKEATVTLNTFNVIKSPNTIVHQYDVAYSGDAKDYSKRKLLQKIWSSKTVKADLGEPSNLWVWDGHKLAW